MRRGLLSVISYLVFPSVIAYLVLLIWSTMSRVPRERKIFEEIASTRSQGDLATVQTIIDRVAQQSAQMVFPFVKDGWTVRDKRDGEETERVAHRERQR